MGRSTPLKAAQKAHSKTNRNTSPKEGERERKRGKKRRGKGRKKRRKGEKKEKGKKEGREEKEKGTAKHIQESKEITQISNAISESRVKRGHGRITTRNLTKDLMTKKGMVSEETQGQ